VRECLSPEWDYEGQFDNYQSGDTLVFALWDEDWCKSDDFLGCAELTAVHFDPVAFEGDLQLSDAGPGVRPTLRVRVELADFQETLGMTTTTGLGIRRRLWGAWAKTAHIPVTQDLAGTPSITGLHVRRKLRSAPSKVAQAMANKKRAAKLALIDMVWSRRELVMTAMRDTLKEALTADPDMCQCLRRWVQDLVDQLWCDITTEVEIMVEATRVGVAGHSMHDVSSLAEVGWQPPNCCHPLAIRGFLLYHWLPYDRSFFGQLKDPVYLVFLAISFVPVLRCFLYLLFLVLAVLPGPPDEYQLVQFIMAFKATQFLSAGVFLALLGTWKYYWCVGMDGRHTCLKYGPGESASLGPKYGYLGVIDIAGSCVLVWIAFLLLPYSVQNAGLRKTEQQEEYHAAHHHAEGHPRRGCSCIGRWLHFKYEGRGGRLGGLLRYDLYCFLLGVCALVGLVWARFDEDPAAFLSGEAQRPLETWKFRETLFVARVLYGWASLPFAVFQLPVLSQILTHTVPTGYNMRGAVVAYLLPPVPPLEDEDQEASTSGDQADPLLPS